MPARKSDFLTRLADAVESQSLWPDGATVVLGVSGGVDSMALLDGLHRLVADGRLKAYLHVAHLNHQLRGAASDEDADFVAEAARKRGIDVTVKSDNIAEQAHGGRGSIEEVARHKRYEFFAQVCVNVGSKTVAVAHQADDQAETVIHRIARGTGLRGLGGIRARRTLEPDGEIVLVRPLLGFRREALRAYLEQHQLPFRDDATNDDDTYTRSRIRRYVMPMLAEHINPNVTDALLRLADQARSLDEYLQDRAAQILETLVVSRTDREVVLNTRALTRKSRILQTEVFRQALLALGMGEQDVSYAHLSSLADLAHRPEGGKEIHLPGGVVVRRDYDRLTFSSLSEAPHELAAANVSVIVPGTTTLPIRRMELVAENDAFELGAFQQWRSRTNRMEEWLDFDAVRFPLVVRSRREGDRFWPLGAPGTKKLADFFKEQRIPSAARDRVAVLCDMLGPVWIVPYRIDERVKVTRSTRRVLRLSARYLTPTGRADA